MHNDGAQFGLKPLVKVHCGSNSQSMAKRYFIVIFVLFIAVVILCINYMAVYKSYKDLRLQFEETLVKMNDFEEGRNNLIASNKKLEKDNKELREKNNALWAQNKEILAQIHVIRKINEQLIEKNKELEDDNIKLQNTLKKAASVGIKPQNYVMFDGISRGMLNRGTYIGQFLGTAYTPSEDECGNNKGITNSGEPIVPGLSIAVDNNYWPFGTVFYIKGLGYAVAMDTGSAIKGKYRFDFAVFDKNFAIKLGQDYWDVYLVKLGNGKVGDLKF